MAESEAQAEEKLYTLSEISQRTGISMPTLQRYKKLYQDRLPSSGQGRKQRYPESALPVFDEIKNENIGRRGRPRKDASAPRPQPVAAKRRPGRPPKAAGKRGGRKAASAPAAQPAAGRRGGRRGRPAAAPARGGRKQKAGNLLTLTQISETTGISYPTLVRYVRLHSDRLPHEGKGRARRFYPQAVDVFRQLRSESGRGGRKKGSAKGTAKGTGRGPGRPPGRPPARRGRPPGRSVASDLGNAVSQRLKAIEKGQQNLEKKLKGLVKGLQKLFR